MPKLQPVLLSAVSAQLWPLSRRRRRQTVHGPGQTERRSCRRPGGAPPSAGLAVVSARSTAWSPRTSARDSGRRSRATILAGADGPATAPAVAIAIGMLVRARYGAMRSCWCSRPITWWRPGGFRRRGGTRPELAGRARWSPIGTSSGCAERLRLIQAEGRWRAARAALRQATGSPPPQSYLDAVAITGTAACSCYVHQRVTSTNCSASARTSSLRCALRSTPPRGDFDAMPRRCRVRRLPVGFHRLRGDGEGPMRRWWCATTSTGTTSVRGGAVWALRMPDARQPHPRRDVVIDTGATARPLEARGGAGRRGRPGDGQDRRRGAGGAQRTKVQGQDVVARG